MQGKWLAGPQGSPLPSQVCVKGTGVPCKGTWGAVQGGMAGERWGCAWTSSHWSVCSSGPAVVLLLQMGCLGSARWAPCRTDPTSRSRLPCSSVCRMSCGISWHKVNRGVWGKSLRPCREGVCQNCLVALELSVVLLAQGPGWAEENGVKPRP